MTGKMSTLSTPSLLVLRTKSAVTQVPPGPTKTTIGTYLTPPTTTPTSLCDPRAPTPRADSPGAGWQSGVGDTARFYLC